MLLVVLLVLLAVFYCHCQLLHSWLNLRIGVLAFAIRVGAVALFAVIWPRMSVGNIFVFLYTMRIALAVVGVRTTVSVAQSTSSSSAVIIAIVWLDVVMVLVAVVHFQVLRQLESKGTLHYCSQ